MLGTEYKISYNYYQLLNDKKATDITIFNNIINT